MGAGAIPAATALGAPPPSVALGTSYGAPMVNRMVANIDAAQRQKEALQKPIYDRMQADVAKDRARVDKLEADYTPVPDAKAPPVPQNDPLKAFGSAAGIFAALASALTHAPAVNAMNGMAAAINAAKANDWKAYEAGYKQWKDNTQLAIEKHRLQAEDMRAAMEKMQSDLSTGVAMAKAVAAASDDRIGAQLLEQGQYEKLGEYLRASETAARQLQESTLRVEALHMDLQNKRTRQGLATEYQNAVTPEAKEAARQKIIAFDAATVPGGAEAAQAAEEKTTPVTIAARNLAKAAATGDPAAIDDAQKKFFEAQQKETAARTVTRDTYATFLDQAGRPITQIKRGDNTEYRDAAGNVTYPTSLTKPATGEAATVAARKDAALGEKTGVDQAKIDLAKSEEARKVAADAERGKHNEAMAKIYSDRALGQADRDRAIEAERERHDRETERLTGDRLKQSVPQPMTPEERISAGAQAATGEPLTQMYPGYNPQAVQMRKEARNAAIEKIISDTGMTAEQAGIELANRSIEYQAGKLSSGQLTTMRGATAQAVGQLDFNIRKTKEEMGKLDSTDISPIINALARGEEKWTGDPAYSSLFYFMHATAVESARILSGAQASRAQLHQGAMEEALKWANVNMTPASFDSVAEAMLDEGRNKLATYETALQGQKLTGVGQVGAARDPGQAQTGAAPTQQGLPSIPASLRGKQLQFNPTKRQWRDKTTGQTYDETGAAVQ